MKETHNMNAKSFNKFLYISICMIAFITLILSGYLVFLLNKMSAEASKNKYIAMKNNEKIEALAKLETDFKSITEDQDRLESYLPDQKDVSRILKDLESMAGENGLSFNSYQINLKNSNSKTKEKADDSQTIKVGDYLVFPFQVVLRGSYVKIDTMMRDMEGYERLIEVKEVKYAKDTTIPGDNVEAILTVNAYLKK